MKPAQPPGAWKRLLKNPVALASMAVLLGILLLAIFGPIVFQTDPTHTSPLQNQPPSRAHFFGTDAELWLHLQSAYALRIGRAKVAAAGLVEDTAHAGSGRNAHILVVDDNATNRMVVEALCEMFDCSTESVIDGVERSEEHTSELQSLV